MTRGQKVAIFIILQIPSQTPLNMATLTKTNGSAPASLSELSDGPNASFTSAFLDKKRNMHYHSEINAFFFNKDAHIIKIIWHTAALKPCFNHSLRKLQQKYDSLKVAHLDSSSRVCRWVPIMCVSSNSVFLSSEQRCLKESNRICLCLPSIKSPQFLFMFCSATREQIHQ